MTDEILDVMLTTIFNNSGKNEIKILISGMYEQVMTVNDQHKMDFRCNIDST